MHTICAAVNPRLLTKANRLFTGTLDGRMIELLQNARRAGATRVDITNAEGRVTIRDNGQGIEDFAKLLDLGGSGWEEALEHSEDPAGVGLFCLAPREVTIRSRGKMATIGAGGWSGTPVEVNEDPELMDGTMLAFPDEPWNLVAVNRHAVFGGLSVTVDGEGCSLMPFLTAESADHPELGCRILVCGPTGLSPWHHSARRDGYNVGREGLINFHGQVVGFDFHTVEERGLHFLVELTGEPTGIRLMLPARTRVVENEAFTQLKLVLEQEAYRYIQRRGQHRLPYKQYLRANELGIELPEAEPTYEVGLLTGDTPLPVAVVMPVDFPLASCFRLSEDCDGGDESDTANLHLLAALGKFESPLVVVAIAKQYDGYSWAKLPLIHQVKMESGAAIQEAWLASGKLICVESLRVTATAEDGRVFSSPVCMAIPPLEPGAPWEEKVLVTREAFTRLNAEDIWHHLGGWNEEGDTYETQRDDFEDELSAIWAGLVGPHEHVRSRIFETLLDLPRGWTQITLQPHGAMTIRNADGTDTLVSPSHGEMTSDV